MTNETHKQNTLHIRFPAPETEANDDKLYHSISEVSQMTGLEPYVLRFWEKEFPTLKPKKNRSGNRVYQKRDIEMVNRIKALLYKENYTIEGARARLRAQQALTDPDVLAQNSSMRDALRDIKRELEDTLKILDEV